MPLSYMNKRCIPSRDPEDWKQFLAEQEKQYAFPEHQVPLLGGSRPSQTDLFVVAQSPGELVSIAVEGKVREPFGPLGWRMEQQQLQTIPRMGDR